MGRWFESNHRYCKFIKRFVDKTLPKRRSVRLEKFPVKSGFPGFSPETHEDTWLSAPLNHQMAKRGSCRAGFLFGTSLSLRVYPLSRYIHFCQLAFRPRRWHCGSGWLDAYLQVEHNRPTVFLLFRCGRIGWFDDGIHPQSHSIGPRMCPGIRPWNC
jgi:hypothetical protein